MFDVFPDNPDALEAQGVANLSASFNAVIQTRAAHTMAVQRYDVVLSDAEGGGFEERYWRPGQFAHVV